MFIRFFTRLLVAAYLTDTGLLLMASPWTNWLRQNFFAAMWPWVGAMMATTPAQVGVVIVGLMTTLAGLAELLQVLVRRHADRVAESGGGPSPR